MKIHIEDLKFKCIIGVLDHERQNEQDVIIDFECKYEFKNEYINKREDQQGFNKPEGARPS